MRRHGERHEARGADGRPHGTPAECRDDPPGDSHARRNACFVAVPVQLRGRLAGPAERRAKATPDPQIKRQLEELKYEFEVDEDGDYKLVFDVGGSTEKRSQLVYVRTPVESYGTLRVREIWSPGYKSTDKDFPASVANRLLDGHPGQQAGAWAKQDEYAVFVVKLAGRCHRQGAATTRSTSPSPRRPDGSRTDPRQGRPLT